MKLTKRFLCLVLSLCMVFLAIPAFTFPIAAADAGDSSAETEVFSSTPALPLEINNQTGSWQIISYDVPADIADSSNANLIDSYMNGYPASTTQTENTFRVPYSYPDGNYTKAPVYVRAVAAALSWGHENAFLFNMVGDTIPVAGYRYTAEHTGYIQANFVDLKRDYSGTASVSLAADTFTGVRIAIFVDGVMVWPTPNADDPSDLSKWEQPYSTPDDFTDIPGKTDPTGKYINHQAEINEELKDLPFYVREGSKVDFLITYTASVKTTDTRRSGNFFRPSISYSKIGAESEPAYQPGKPLDDGQKFVETGIDDPDDANAEISYPGDWSMIVYDKPADIDDRKSALIDHYTTHSTTTRAFLTAYKDYLAAGDAPLLVNHAANANYGQNNSFLFNTSSKAPAAVGGYRYTAEYAGYIQANFDELAKDRGGSSLPAASFTGVRIAIFVDGVMVWPTAGADATDYANWCAPYSVPDDFVDVPRATDPVVDTNYFNQRVEINKELKNKSFFVREGSQVDFLITYAEDVSSAQRTANIFLPSVSYDTVVETDFAASATLGTNLALNFWVDATTDSFQPSNTNTYLDADTLKLTLSGGAEGFRFDTVTSAQNGLLTATVSDIAAKQMTDAVNYTLTVDAKKPNGETEQAILAEGSISVASYMKALYDATEDTEKNKNLRDLILATAQYGAEAQKYFDYKTDALATDVINGDISFTLSDAVDGYNQDAERSDPYIFSGVAVLLEDTVQLKLLLDATNGALADWGSLYLKVNGKKADATISTRINDDGTYLKVILDVPFAEFATDYTITLHAADDTTVSSMLIYSVETYAARTANLEDQKDLLTAIRTVGQAARNYFDGNVVTRIGILSDTHIGKGWSLDVAKTTNALESINNFFGDGQTDAVIFLGDNTDGGTDDDYATLLEIVRGSTLYQNGTPFRFVTGNHEFYRDADGDKKKDDPEDVIEAFKEKFIEFQDEIDHTLIVNGIYFIGLSTRTRDVANGNGYEEAEAYLRQQVAAAAAANPKAPIIIYSHIGYGDIAEPHPQIDLSSETAEFLKNYPQIIWFSGHTHEMLQDPHVIGQKYYTSIQAPTAGALLSDVNIEGSGIYSTDHSQGMMMTISDTNVVKIYRYDFATGEVIGQIWTIDIPAVMRSRSNFTYSLADRPEIAAAPKFDKTATVETVELTSSYAAFKLPLAHVRDSVSNDVVSFYHVSVLDENGTEIVTSSIYSNFFRGSRMEDYIPFSTTSLSPETTYTLQIVAESVYGKLSAPLTISFTTLAADKNATLNGLNKLLDVDYTTGKRTDKMKHDSATVKDPVLAAGQAASFDGVDDACYYKLIEDDWAAMKNSLTIETVLTIDSSNTKAVHGLFSNMHYGGFGLFYNGEEQTLNFAIFDLYNAKFTDDVDYTAYEVTVSVPVELDKALHIVATATGNVMCIYINGELKGTVCFEKDVYRTIGNAEDKKDTNNNIHVAADSTQTSRQYYTKCTVEIVRLYADGVTPEQAALMYQNSSVAQ